MVGFPGVVTASGHGLATWESRLTKETIIVSEKEGSLSLLAEVNGKYFYQPTRHCAVFRGGKNGDKSVFRAFVDHKSFYESLMRLGFKPGNNMTFENKERTFVKGDLLDVTVTWDGINKEYSLDEVIEDSNGNPIQMRFGGNLSNALKKKTGCLLCLDSCPVGIVSNASYTYGSVEKRKEVTFVGKKSVLPPDGSLVVIKIRPKK
jgi:hypothetical protein